MLNELFARFDRLAEVIYMTVERSYFSWQLIELIIP